MVFTPMTLHFSSMSIMNNSHLNCSQTNLQSIHMMLAKDAYVQYLQHDYVYYCNVYTEESSPQLTYLHCS